MPDDREARVVALLEDAVLDELRVYVGRERLSLTDSQVDGLMRAVTSRVLYAFDVDWSPDWVAAGGVHAWEVAGDHFARCPLCLYDSPPMANIHQAVEWAQDHAANHSD